jgi:hypothetical protein
MPDATAAAAAMITADLHPMLGEGTELAEVGVGLAVALAGVALAVALAGVGLAVALAGVALAVALAGVGASVPTGPEISMTFSITRSVRSSPRSTAGSRQRSLLMRINLLYSRRSLGLVSRSSSSFRLRAWVMSPSIAS